MLIAQLFAPIRGCVWIRSSMALENECDERVWSHTEPKSKHWFAWPLDWSACVRFTTDSPQSPAVAIVFCVVVGFAVVIGSMFAAPPMPGMKLVIEPLLISPRAVGRGFKMLELSSVQPWSPLALWVVLPVNALPVNSASGYQP